MKKGMKKFADNRIFASYQNDKGEVHYQGKRQVKKYQNHPLIRCAIKEKSKIQMVKFIRNNYQEPIDLRTALGFVNSIMHGSSSDFMTTMNILDTNYTYCGLVEVDYANLKKANLSNTLMPEEEISIIETNKLKTIRSQLKELVFMEMYGAFGNQSPSILMKNYRNFSTELVKRIGNKWKRTV